MQKIKFGVLDKESSAERSNDNDDPMPMFEQDKESFKNAIRVHLAALNKGEEFLPNDKDLQDLLNDTEGNVEMAAYAWNKKMMREDEDEPREKQKYVGVTPEVEKRGPNQADHANLENTNQKQSHPQWKFGRFKHEIVQKLQDAGFSSATMYQLTEQIIELYLSGTKRNVQEAMNRWVKACLVREKGLNNLDSEEEGGCIKPLTMSINSSTSDVRSEEKPTKKEQSTSFLMETEVSSSLFGIYHPANLDEGQVMIQGDNPAITVYKDDIEQRGTKNKR